MGVILFDHPRFLKQFENLMWVQNFFRFYMAIDISLFVYVSICKYSRTSMAQTLMAHSPGLARTMIMVSTGLLKHNPPWTAGTTLD